MSRRLAAAFVLAGLSAGCRPSEPPPPAERFHLVLMTVSSLRADHLGIYGYQRNLTPSLDLFAASGAVFLEAGTPWPETGRAAAAMLTGMDPARVTSDLAARATASALRSETTLAAELQAHGYRTVAAVSHPALAAKLGFATGFDQFEEFWSLPASETTEAVTTFGVEALAAATPEQPTFVWLHFAAPERPDEAPEEDLAALAGDGLTPESPQFRMGETPIAADPGGPGYGARVDRYDAAIRSVDRAAARVLDAITTGAASAKTLVAVVGLHGESLGEHGTPFERPRALFRETLQVPMLLGWPGVEPPTDEEANEETNEEESRFFSGKRVGAAVTIADIGATARELIGAADPNPPLTPPAGTIGKSLVAVIHGNEVRPHRRLYSQSEAGLFAVFDGRLRLLRIPVPGDAPPHFALFNLVRDPNEANDSFRAGSTAEPLRAELETRRIQTVAWRQKNERDAGTGAALSPELADALAALGYR